jgi:hypothetical protein
VRWIRRVRSFDCFEPLSTLWTFFSTGYDIPLPSVGFAVYHMLHEDPGNIQYSDIGGLTEQIRELREVIELPLINPQLFLRVGIKPPKGLSHQVYLRLFPFSTFYVHVLLFSLRAFFYSFFLCDSLLLAGGEIFILHCFFPTATATGVPDRIDALQACCSMAHRARERLCWPVPWPRMWRQIL